MLCKMTFEEYKQGESKFWIAINDRKEIVNRLCKTTRLSTNYFKNIF